MSFAASGNALKSAGEAAKVMFPAADGAVARIAVSAAESKVMLALAQPSVRLLPESASFFKSEWATLRRMLSPATV